MTTWKELFTKSVEFRTRFHERPDVIVTQHQIADLYEILAEMELRMKKLEGYKPAPTWRGAGP
jgi:hypothetical protein